MDLNFIYSYEIRCHIETTNGPWFNQIYASVTRYASKLKVPLAEDFGSINYRKLHGWVKKLKN